MEILNCKNAKYAQTSHLGFASEKAITRHTKPYGLPLPLEFNIWVHLWFLINGRFLINGWRKSRNSWNISGFCTREKNG